MKALAVMALWLAACASQGAGGGITGSAPDAGAQPPASCSGYHHGIRSCTDLLCPSGPATDLECYQTGVPCWCFSAQSWCTVE